MPIRWRLTLWFTLILCAILVLSSAVYYLLLKQYLYEEVDDNLTVYSARVHGTLNPQEIPIPLDYYVIHSKLPPINEFDSPGVYIQIVDADGNIVVKSDSLGVQELPVNRALIENGLNNKVTIATLSATDGTRVRVMVSPLNINGQILLLQVGVSLRFVDATMRLAAWAVLAGTLVALTLTALLGTLLVRRTLAPVERITRTAQEIEASSDLSRRVGYVGVADEVGRLAATFDHLIGHLKQVFDAQGRFVADASHDLRSPLTVIQGNIDLLKRKMSEQDRRESLRTIESETRRMSRIVNDLLLLADIESGHFEPRTNVRLKDVVMDEVRRAQRLAGSRSIIIEHADDIAVTGDDYRLKRMLGNLLDNAIKHTPETGRIAVSLLCDRQWARLEVADSGIGISPEHLPHIFERFYRTEEARSREKGSTGLGLAIVKAIAEEHSGRVEVASEPDKGSTFTVWLKI